MIARVLIKKVEACRSGEFLDSKENLRYEHFIGPLVILCAVNNLQRAQSTNTGDQESIASVKLCFDQFERYYAKAISVSALGSRRSNSMSGSSAFPVSRVDSSSFEVQPDHFKNFTLSLKKFIEFESLPCKENLR